jgi:Fe-S-cluster containining protein
MNKKEKLIKHFAPYCSQCNGSCCKRGVFSLFDREMKKLSHDYKDFHVGKISDQRGTCFDIAMQNLCVFSKDNGCELPEKLRPTDCLTYPFYPKVKENSGELEIEYFVIDSDCPYHKEIAGNEVIFNEVQSIWESVSKKVTPAQVNDWLGKDGQWKDWFEKAIQVNFKKLKKIMKEDGLQIIQMKRKKAM